jgi:hypothetical protein
MSGRSAMPGDLPELNVPAELDPHNKPDSPGSTTPDERGDAE